MIPYVKAFDPEYGVCRRVSPRIRRVTANNPGPFTFTGTGTYIVGNGTVAVIDPGPDDAAHLKALLAAVEGETVSHVLVTHTHRDHAPLARPFADAVGALVLAARPPARETHASGGLDEAEDQAFRPDVILTDGDRIVGPDWTLETLATPGHASNHLAFALIEENALFSGDHVMGWATSVVAPPDGDMGAYMDSLERVTARGFKTLWPTHGAPVTDVAPFLTAYRTHRLEREAQILARLEAGDRTIGEMVPALYAAVDQRLWPAASLSVLAHLIDLVRRGLVVCDGEAGLGSVFRPA
ncbi:MAG: glyoxylase-like metal-dependent hydrolase (beta-lactamase superfamily II) [Brevundimonas sp.]|jgi:glyoxylase-like metal-dependent hydrolase (beta-lactamase superfamily II)|uniref:MBL fold metallo-hydrolase n=1 Tax=Brevundimonas sp. TaxID=1871086 RepID=UPI0039E5A1AA